MSKDWIFLVAAVAFAALAIAWAGRSRRADLRGSGARLRPPSGRAPGRVYALEPLPSDIIAALDAVPAMQQSRASAAYTGLRVRWRVTLQSSFPSGLTINRLMFLDRGDFPWVLCDVNRWKYPQLQALEKDTPLWACGRIVGIQGDEIRLRNVILEFDT